MLILTITLADLTDDIVIPDHQMQNIKKLNKGAKMAMDIVNQPVYISLTTISERVEKVNETILDLLQVDIKYLWFYTNFMNHIFP